MQPMLQTTPLASAMRSRRVRDKGSTCKERTRGTEPQGLRHRGADRAAWPTTTISTSGCAAETALHGSCNAHHYVGEAFAAGRARGAGGDPEFLVAVGVARFELGISPALPVAEVLLGQVALDFDGCAGEAAGGVQDVQGLARAAERARHPDRILRQAHRGPGDLLVVAAIGFEIELAGDAPAGFLDRRMPYPPPARDGPDRGLRHDASETRLLSTAISATCSIAPRTSPV